MFSSFDFLNKTNCIYYTCRIFRNFFIDSVSRLLLKTALFVLRSVQSLVASDQGIGPSGCDKTSFMSRFLLCEIAAIIPKWFLSAFNMIFLSFWTISFDFNVLKEFNFIFGKISKNFITLFLQKVFSFKS